MFKIINTIVFSVVATVALSANVQAQTLTLVENGTTFTFTKTPDNRADDVKAAAEAYVSNRKDHARDMVALHKADTGEVLDRRAIGSYGDRKGEAREAAARHTRYYKNEVIFSTERAPEDMLRDVGMANDLRASKVPTNFWVFTDKAPKDFEALYGKPAYTVELGNSMCYSEVPRFDTYAYHADITMGTYVDLTRDNQVVEIHVTSCKYTEGPYKGTSVIKGLSPVMKGVNFIERYAAQENRVQGSTIGNGKRY